MRIPSVFMAHQALTLIWVRVTCSDIESIAIPGTNSHASCVHFIDQAVRYETESMHMQLRDDNAASAESVPADSSASIHPHIDSLTGYHMAHIVFRNKHPSNFESDEENAAWEKMSEGLQTLIDKG